MHFVGCKINHGPAMALALPFAVASGKGPRTPSRECARDSPCLLGVVYISGIWIRFWGLRSVGCIELLGMGVPTFMSRATSSKAGLGLCPPGGEVFKDISSVRIYIFFPSLCQVETKIKYFQKKKKIGTSEYINMILFVQIKNFIGTCIIGSQ